MKHWVFTSKQVGDDPLQFDGFFGLMRYFGEEKAMICEVFSYTLYMANKKGAEVYETEEILEDISEDFRNDPSIAEKLRENPEFTKSGLWLKTNVTKDDIVEEIQNFPDLKNGWKQIAQSEVPEEIEKELEEQQRQEEE